MPVLMCGFDGSKEYPFLSEFGLTVTFSKIIPYIPGWSCTPEPPFPNLEDGPDINEQLLDSYTYNFS